MFKKLFPILCLTLTISGSIILLLPVLLGLVYEPPRVCRRLFCLSYAATAGSSSVA